MGVGSNIQTIEQNKISAYNQYTSGNYLNIGYIYSLNPFDLLGKGAFGQVYVGKNIFTNENVAIKIESKYNSYRNNYIYNKSKKYILFRSIKFIISSNFCFSLFKLFLLAFDSFLLF